MNHYKKFYFENSINQNFLVYFPYNRLDSCSSTLNQGVMQTGLIKVKETQRNRLNHAQKIGLILNLSGKIRFILNFLKPKMDVYSFFKPKESI